VTRPIAYSYARFSTPEQERGDSERRQIEAARQYAEQHGFVLDESIVVDRGISAFAGRMFPKAPWANSLSESSERKSPEDLRYSSNLRTG
jgi:hypothetical protein